MAKRFEVRAYGDEREVLVDGHPIEHLISYKIEENVDAPPTVTLKFDIQTARKTLQGSPKLHGQSIFLVGSIPTTNANFLR